MISILLLLLLVIDMSAGSLRYSDGNGPTTLAKLHVAKLLREHVQRSSLLQLRLGTTLQ
jgi:hypothetical protein